LRKVKIHLKFYVSLSALARWMEGVRLTLPTGTQSVGKLIILTNRWNFLIKLALILVIRV